jgi:hypothetical protein
MTSQGTVRTSPDCPAEIVSYFCFRFSRTRACKQALALRTGFLSDLGGEDRASVAQRELAQRGAILGAMIEDQEARWLRGDGLELTEYCTLVNAQRCVLADIGLERRPRVVTPSLNEYLKTKE